MDRHAAFFHGPVTPLLTRSTPMHRWLLTLTAFVTFPTLAAAQSTTQVVEYYHTDALALRLRSGRP